MSADARQTVLISLSLAEFGELIEQRVAAALEAQAKPPELLTREALARALDISVATVGRLRDDGLPTIFVGDSPRFKLTACLAWIEERSRQRQEGGAR